MRKVNTWFIFARHYQDIYLAAITIIFFTYLFALQLLSSSRRSVATGPLLRQRPLSQRRIRCRGHQQLVSAIVSLASAFVRAPYRWRCWPPPQSGGGYYRYAREMMVPAAAGEADRAEPAAEMALEEESGEENPEHQQ